MKVREAIQAGHRYINAMRPCWNRGDLRRLRDEAAPQWRDVCMSEREFDAEAAACVQDPTRDQAEFRRLGKVWLETWQRAADWLEANE